MLIDVYHTSSKSLRPGTISPKDWLDRIWMIRWEQDYYQKGWWLVITYPQDKKQVYKKYKWDFSKRRILLRRGLPYSNAIWLCAASFGEFRNCCETLAFLKGKRGKKDKQQQNHRRRGWNEASKLADWYVLHALSSKDPTNMDALQSNLAMLCKNVIFGIKLKSEVIYL